MADKVLIWCLEREMYWKANSHGYTQELSEAGLYQRGRAESICKNANAQGKEEERIIELDEAFTSLQISHRLLNTGKQIHSTPQIEKKKQTCWECGAKFMGYRDECLDCFRERKDLPR